MATENPTFSSSTPKQEARKKTIEEGLRILSEKLRQVIGSRHIEGIKHESFTDGFQQMIQPGSSSANYHMFTVDLENKERVFGLRVPRRNPFNLALRLHTEVDMARAEEWIYDFDGQSQVEVTDPKGKKETMTLNEEYTIDSLVAYLKSTMTRNKVAEEAYTG